MARRMNPWLGWALALAVAGAFCSLGFWQLGRAWQKAGLQLEADRTLQMRYPQSLAMAADPRRAASFDWAAGDGEFAEAPAILLDNQSRDERAGVRAYRLFKPSQGMPLLVDLGWLPLAGNREMPTIARPNGTILVKGLLVPPPSHGLIMPIANMQANGDVLTTGLGAAGIPSALAVKTLPPRILRLDPAMENLGYARDLDVLPNTMPPARHLAYAVQWFGLALAVLATATILTFRRRRAGREKMAA